MLLKMRDITYGSYYFCYKCYQIYLLKSMHGVDYFASIAKKLNLITMSYHFNGVGSGAGFEPTTWVINPIVTYSAICSSSIGDQLHL